MATEELYDTICKCATSMRKRYSSKPIKPNVLKYWGFLEAILYPLSKIIFPSFKKPSKTLYDNIMILPEKITDGFGNSKMIECNHLIIQLVRIPAQEEPLFIKLMQLAFCWGLFKGLNRNERQELDEGIGRTVSKEEFDSLGIIHTFISRQNLALLDKYIIDSQIDIDTLCSSITLILNTDIDI